jgi:hypothetical protein
MSVTTTPERPVKKWRVIVFALVAVVYALLSLVLNEGLFALVELWFNVLSPAVQSHDAAMNGLLGRIGRRWH